MIRFRIEFACLDILMIVGLDRAYLGVELGHIVIGIQEKAL